MELNLLRISYDVAGAKIFIDRAYQVPITSVADPDPGSGAFWPLDRGWVKNQDPDP